MRKTQTKRICHTDSVSLIDAATDQLEHQLAEYGFAYTDIYSSTDLFGTICSEATQLTTSAKEAKSESTEVKYSSRIAELGDAACDLLFNDAFVKLISGLSGMELTPSRDLSCTTFYEQGHYLGPHLDKPAQKCSFTVIFYVEVVAPKNDAKIPHICVYSRHPSESSVSTREIDSIPGRMVMGFGARVWHERPKLDADQRVVALTVCYANVPS